MTIRRLDVVNCRSWDLILALCYYRNYPNLTKDQHNEVYKAVYAKNDAYGPEGFVPPQGYDWSGIRDSSDSAKTKMCQVGREYLLNHGVQILEYRSE
jgi:hypothetical protein